MPALTIKLDGDDCWPDLADKSSKGLLIESDAIEVALLPGGMQSGKAAVALRIELPDGRTLLVQTSEELFSAAARAFRGRLQWLEEQRARGRAGN